MILIKVLSPFLLALAAVGLLSADTVGRGVEVIYG